MNTKIDPCIEFQKGTNNTVIAWQEGNPLPTSPIVVRGTYHKHVVDHCKVKRIDYYIIENGYLGMQKSKSHSYWRVTKNNHQYLGPVIKRLSDRFLELQLDRRPIKRGNKVLLALPSKELITYLGLDYDDWTNDITDELAKHSYRDVIVRAKPERKDRMAGDTFNKAIEQDIHSVVCFNSICGVEALLRGIPVIELGRSAVEGLCSRTVHDIEKASVPFPREVTMYMSHLAYMQYTMEELTNGFAWEILNG